MLVESKEVLEVTQTSFGYEKFVEESSTIFIEDVLVSNKVEHNSYEDPLEQPMILDSGHENNEEGHLILFEVYSQDIEIMHCF